MARVAHGGWTVIMSAKLAITLIAAVAASSVADTTFVGRWIELRSQTHCSVVLGFDLRADGSATIDWAELNAIGGGTKLHSVVSQRSGQWTSNARWVHLTIVDTGSTEPQTPPPARNASVVKLVGSLLSSGRLDGVITDARDRNIDGQPYVIHCAYRRPN